MINYKGVLTILFPWEDEDSIATSLVLSSKPYPYYKPHRKDRHDLIECTSIRRYSTNAPWKPRRATLGIKYNAGHVFDEVTLHATLSFQPPQEKRNVGNTQALCVLW